MERPEATREATASAGAHPGRLPVGLKLAYGMPAFAGSAMGIPIAIHMTKFYSDTVGVALGFIAIAQVLARSLDAITDPLMGWISDRTRTRWGRRRVWILIGAPISAVAFVGLFAPPTGLPPLTAAAWFTLTFTGFFVLNTIYSIPHYGLGAELTLDYNERSSLFAYRDAIVLVGITVASVVPAYLVAKVKQAGADQAEAERMVYLWFAVGMSTLLVLLYAWMCYRVPENPAFYRRKSNPLVPGVRRVLRNRPFRILLGCYLISSISGAIPGILMPYYMQYVLGLENYVEWLGWTLLAAYASGFVSIPFWLRLARRYGKKPIWITAYVLLALCFGPLFVVPDLLPGESGVYGMLVCLTLGGMTVGANGFLAPSIQADVIDYDEFYTGKRREAQYGALWAIATKFAVIPSASLTLTLLAVLGFEPNVEQTPTVQWVIRGIYGLGPATFALLAMCGAFFFPVNERVHSAILAGIRAHERGEPAVDPLTGELVPPPEDQELDEETGWFLDHFSPGELRRALKRGHRTLLRDALIATTVSALICGGASAVVVVGVGDFSEPPGLFAVLGVLVFGIALTGVCFHAIRIRAAVKARAVPAEHIRTHLEGRRGPVA